LWDRRFGGRVRVNGMSFAGKDGIGVGRRRPVFVALGNVRESPKVITGEPASVRLEYINLLLSSQLS